MRPNDWIRGLAIIASVCLILGVGNLITAPADTMTMPVTADVVPATMPPPPVVVPVLPCPGGVCPLVVPAVHKRTVEKSVTVETNAATVEVREHRVAGAVCGVGKCAVRAVGKVVGVERRQARREARRG